MDRYHYLSFSSAGTNGVSYIGVLDALEEHMGADYEAWRANVKGVAGCSSGAIVGLMLVLGLSRKKRAALLSTFDIHHVLRDPDIAMLWHQYGITEGSSLLEIAQEVLNQGGLSIQSTFADLRRLLRVDFVCVASELSTSRAVYFSAKATPEVRVADAVCASCCVPIAFRPHSIQGRVYVDGCLTCSQPDLFDHESTLFVTVTSPPSGAPDSWVTYLASLMRCAQESQLTTMRLATTGDGARAPNVLSVDLTGRPGFDVNMDDARMRLTWKRGFVDAMSFVTEGRLHKACQLACRIYLHACDTSYLTVDDESPPAARAAGDEGLPRREGPA